ncbi:MAG: HYExAFE family protein [Planctomycetota bacterium]
MAKRHNHYEAAFEDYLRSRQIAYIAVNEQRRPIEAGGSLKNIDFIASPSDQSSPRWLIDVKGRRFPSGRQYWRNWTTDEELQSLERWSARFGNDFLGVLVFAYELVGDRSPVPPHEVHFFRDRPYAFVAVPADRYRAIARPLSARWGTVSAPVATFRETARPVATSLAVTPADLSAIA